MNILGIGAHPDDLEIACGGTLAKYAKSGHKVFMCHISNGNMGHALIMPDELISIRKKEAIEAAKKLGAEDVSVDIGTGDIEVDASNQSIIKNIVEIIRWTKPDVIITHNPDDYMQDHMEASRLAYNASFASSLVHYATKTPSFGNIPSVFYMDTLAGVNFIPTEYVDISDTIEAKLEALSCHESQVKWMLDHDHIDFVDFVRTCSKYRGLQCGVPYAEGFRQYSGWPRFKTVRLLP